jgi:hypothetical protein
MEHTRVKVDAGTWVFGKVLQGECRVVDAKRVSLYLLGQFIGRLHKGPAGQVRLYDASSDHSVHHDGMGKAEAVKSNPPQTSITSRVAHIEILGGLPLSIEDVYIE